MAATVFLSHASKDRKIAETICQSLESRGVQCWMATRDVHPGENFQEAIVRAIRAAKVMLFVFSANSNNSDEVKKEIALAGREKVFVIPVRVEDVAANEALAYEFATRQWIDLFNDWESSLEQLMTQIKAVTAMQTPAEAADDADKPRQTKRAAAETAPPPPTEFERPSIDVDALYEQANAHARAGEYDQAIDQYNRVIGERPDHANALNNRGNALLAKGQQEPAISDFDRAIALKPDFAAAYCNRGNAFQARSEYDHAIRDYTVALQLRPDLAAALTNRAATYDRKGLHDMARKDRAAAAALTGTPAASAARPAAPHPPLTAPSPMPSVVSPANNNRLILMIGGGVLGLLLVIAVVASLMRGAGHAQSGAPALSGAVAQSGEPAVADSSAPTASVTDANAKGDAAFQQKDYTGAMQWYLIAANQGDSSAEYNVAWLYDNGDGVAQDYGQALQWYLKSANQGDKDAQNNLGELYYYGHGVTADYATAFHWYQLAANQGEQNGEFNLGWLYANGQGVTEDDAAARMWMSRSAAQGKQDAINWLQQHPG